MRSGKIWLTAATVAMLLFLAVGTVDAQDECIGLNRWDCNQHPACETFHGDPGYCYYVYHSFCECRALYGVVADICSEAVELIDGPFDLEYDCGLMANDYALTYPNDCTGYSSNGPDGVMYVELEPGGMVEVHMQPLGTGYDSSLYIVTDCADPMGTCVAGADDTYSGDEETLTFESAGGGIYYIIFDAYTSTPTAQSIRVWGDVAGSMTTVNSMTWGAIKAIYR